MTTCTCVFVHVSKLNIPIHSCLQTYIHIFIERVHYVIAASPNLVGQNGSSFCLERRGLFKDNVKITTS